EAAIVNQVLVSADDPDYKDPTKPVGSFYTKEETEKLLKERPDWIIKEVKPANVERRFRRVVASPDPIKNMEYIAIRRMLDSGIVVIASGGGGVPVVYNKDGHLRGTAAVIDKDLAGEKLAEVVGADILLILTDVPHALINFGKPDQKAVEKVSFSEMQKLYDEGHFKSGSMGPKVKAALRFIEFGGDRSIITSLDQAFDAVRGKTGTQIVPDWKM
ncbi:carbamate kinase, partial [Candidatus Dependentiae bacterium]|nr:carbamate kinase [Candidatus Dependentiae bacterium]